jgi:hypothetical protein
MSTTQQASVRDYNDDPTRDASDTSASEDTDDAERERCEGVNPATGKRCPNGARRDGLCALCANAVTKARVDDVTFDPEVNATPFAEFSSRDALYTDARGERDA